MGNSSSIFAYHVLKVKSDSPAAKANLQSYFDYIIRINGTPVNEQNQSLLVDVARNSLNKPIDLVVYNSRVDAYRNLTIIPSTGWGDDGILGCSVRFLDCSNANERVWHILNVAPGSAAERVGIVPMKDYVVCSLDRVLINEEDFYFLIEKNPKRKLKLVIYNSDMDSCREVGIETDVVDIIKGSIGCSVGFGAFHRIPYNEETVKKLVSITNSSSLLRVSEAPVLLSQMTERKETDKKELDLQNVIFSPEIPVPPQQQLLQQEQIQSNNQTNNEFIQQKQVYFDEKSQISVIQTEFIQQASTVVTPNTPEHVYNAQIQQQSPSNIPITGEKSKNIPIPVESNGDAVPNLVDTSNELFNHQLISQQFSTTLQLNDQHNDNFNADDFKNQNNSLTNSIISEKAITSSSNDVFSLSSSSNLASQQYNSSDIPQLDISNVQQPPFQQQEIIPVTQYEELQSIQQPVQQNVNVQEKEISFDGQHDMGDIIKLQNDATMHPSVIVEELLKPQQSLTDLFS